MFEYNNIHEKQYLNTMDEISVLTKEIEHIPRFVKPLLIAKTVHETRE